MAQKKKIDKARANKIISLLKKTYPDSHCALKYETPFQLLVATVLSAQCTDKRVNQVTPVLFAKYPSPFEMEKASLAEIEEIIRSTGFFRNKARSILETSKALVKKWKGKVPEDLERLTSLKGVGRKTANVVLGNAFGVPGMVVDTHVGRISRRMGLSLNLDPVKVEFDLMKVIPQEDWTVFSHLLIDHGRKICTSRRAYCEKCTVQRLCPKVGAVP